MWFSQPNFFLKSGWGVYPIHGLAVLKVGAGRSTPSVKGFQVLSRENFENVYTNLCIWEHFHWKKLHLPNPASNATQLLAPTYQLSLRKEDYCPMPIPQTTPLVIGLGRLLTLSPPIHTGLIHHFYFLIFGRSGAQDWGRSARASECQKLKMVG